MKHASRIPKYIKPYESLATVADRQGNWTAAEEYSRALLQLDPDDFAGAYLINAVANANLNRIDAAELLHATACGWIKSARSRG
jgi:tetratricopeptide (TPR) repeat protein